MSQCPKEIKHILLVWPNVEHPRQESPHLWILKRNVTETYKTVTLMSHFQISGSRTKFTMTSSHPGTEKSHGSPAFESFMLSRSCLRGSVSYEQSQTCFVICFVMCLNDLSEVHMWGFLLIVNWHLRRTWWPASLMSMTGDGTGLLYSTSPSPRSKLQN